MRDSTAAMRLFLMPVVVELYQQLFGYAGGSRILSCLTVSKAGAVGAVRTLYARKRSEIAARTFLKHIPRAYTRAFDLI